MLHAACDMRYVSNDMRWPARIAFKILQIDAKNFTKLTATAAWAAFALWLATAIPPPHPPLPFCRPLCTICAVTHALSWPARQLDKQLRRSCRPSIVIIARLFIYDLPHLPHMYVHSPGDDDSNRSSSLVQLSWQPTPGQRVSAVLLGHNLRLVQPQKWTKISLSGAEEYCVDAWQRTKDGSALFVLCTSLRFIILYSPAPHSFPLPPLSL